MALDWMTLTRTILLFVIFHLLMNQLFPPPSSTKPQTNFCHHQRRETSESDGSRKVNCPPCLCPYGPSSSSSSSFARKKENTMQSETEKKNEKSKKKLFFNREDKRMASGERSVDGIEGQGGGLQVQHVGPQIDEFLSLTRPIWPLDPSTNQIQVPTDTKRICIDVGAYLTAPSSQHWWKKDPSTFVVALEPNLFSYTMSHPTFMAHLQSYMPPDSASSGGCHLRSLRQCLNSTWGFITESHRRFLALNAAAGDTAGYQYMHLGVPGRPDGGSLLGFQPRYWNRHFSKKKNIEDKEQDGTRLMSTIEHQAVPVIRLSALLALLPTKRTAKADIEERRRSDTNNHDGDDEEIIWDTLKIDAQGMDSFIIQGGGERQPSITMSDRTKSLLKRFLCIIGEFDDQEYVVKGHQNHPNQQQEKQRGGILVTNKKEEDRNSTSTKKKKEFQEATDVTNQQYLRHTNSPRWHEDLNKRMKLRQKYGSHVKFSGGNNAGFDYKSFLVMELGFYMVNAQVFINPARFRAILDSPSEQGRESQRGKYLCSAVDVKLTHEKIISVLNEGDQRVLSNNK